MSSPKRRKRKKTQPDESAFDDAAAHEAHQREKRRKDQAKYRQRPEYQEKQRILMAQRRAAVKARRRQWDPPKKLKSPELAEPSENGSHDSVETLDPYADSNNRNAAVAGLTSAEWCALEVLSELRNGTSEPVDPNGQMPATFVDPMRSNSPSRASSVAAAHEEPVRTRYQETFVSCRSKPLPRYVTPETALQKKMRRELGILGSLSHIQAVQLQAFKLRKPTKYPEDFYGINPPLPSEGPFLSSVRWNAVSEWRQQLTGFDEDWDVPVRRELAEDALQRRLLYQAKFV
ncbi:hypothetical protein K438DRAFT_1764566 [Mycena galopus ATCC 62051]|nr:hypothetical protein K438DRAFT_1764566 [Mycena galopus ATCC 62051]